MPHPALLSPHSLFGGREKGKRKGKKVQRRHPPRSHPIIGKAPPPKMQVKKNSGANAPKLAKEVQKSSSSFPHQKKPGCTRPPRSPLSVQSTASPNPHWHAFSGAALGVGVGVIIGGEGTSSFGSIRRPKQGKKKNRRLASHAMVPRGRSWAPSRRPVRIRRLTAFFGVGRWRSSSGSAAWRARTRKRICCRFAALGSRAVGLFGEAGVGVAISQRAPEGVPGALGRGAGREKKGEGICAGQDLERVPGLHVRVDKEVHV